MNIHKSDRSYASISRLAKWARVSFGLLFVWSSGCGSPQKPPPVVWQHTWNPSRGSDGAYFLALDKGGITLGGYDDQYHLKYQLDSGLAFQRVNHDGYAVWNHSENPSPYIDRLSGLAADESGIYTVVSTGASSSTPSRWRLQKLNTSDHTVVWAHDTPQSSLDNVVRAVAADSEALYLAASYRIGDDDTWRLQRRSKGDGIEVWTKDVDPIAERNDKPTTVSVFGDSIYVAGIEDRSQPYGLGGWVWRVHRHDRRTGELIWSQTLAATTGSQEPASSAADAEGVYVVGSVVDKKRRHWRVEKRRTEDGSVVWETQFDGAASAAAVDMTGLYVVGSGPSGAGAAVWRVEKRSKSDGALIWSDTMNPRMQFGGGSATAIELDSAGAAYIAGFYTASPDDDDLGWRLEKRIIR